MSHKMVALAAIGAISAAAVIFTLPSPSANTKGSSHKPGVVIVRGTNAPLRPVQTRMPTPGPTESPVIDRTESPATDREAVYQARLLKVSNRTIRLTTAIPPIKLLHDKIRSEGRDEKWATNSESLLQREFDNLAKSYGSGQEFNINCGTTLCEVHVTHGPNKEFNIKSDDYIQSIAFIELLEKIGFHDAGTAFGKDSAGKNIVLSYYRR